MGDTVERTIKFGVLDWKNNGQAINIENIAHSINNLDWHSGERYYTTSMGVELVVFIDSEKDPIKGQIGTTRRKELPGTETLGTRGVLTLNRNTGIFEPSHFIIFLNKYNVPMIAYEYNMYAPRISRLGEYIKVKFPSEIDWFGVNLISSGDVSTALNRMGKVKKLKIKALSSCSFGGLNGSINNAFTSLKKALHGEVIEFVVMVGRKKGAKLNMPSNNKIATFMSSSDAEELLQYFKIEYMDKETNTREETDLVALFLQERVVVKKQNADYRVIDSDDMYAQLQQAINKNKGILDGIRL